MNDDKGIHILRDVDGKLVEVATGTLPAPVNTSTVFLKKPVSLDEAKKTVSLDEAIDILSDDLDEDDPLWLINGQITDLMEGWGASEDHRDVIEFLSRATKLPRKTVLRLHRALVCCEDPEDKRIGAYTEPDAAGEEIALRKMLAACGAD
jgi:hypothetical protein